jgi:hypothetical protein
MKLGIVARALQENLGRPTLGDLLNRHLIEVNMVIERYLLVERPKGNKRSFFAF